MRRLIADAIESRILLLDEIDGDVEVEKSGSDEERADIKSSLGAAATWINQSLCGRRLARWTPSRGVTDAEPDADLRHLTLP